MHILWSATVLGGLAQSVTGAALALLAAQAAGSDAAAGLPQTLLVVGAALAAIGIGELTRRTGRALALAAGAGIAAAGSLVTLAGAVTSNLTAVLAGSVLMGAGNTAVMLGRYAAAELSEPERRSRAMASVLVATTLGAVVGPNLLAGSAALGERLGLGPLGGPYVVGALAFVMAAVLLGALRKQLPAVALPVTRAPAARPDRATVLGIGTLAIANLVMVGVMTLAPVHLHHLGVDLGMIGLVVSLHIAGMFAPSPLSGRLVERIGAGRATAVAAGTLIAAGLLAAAGGESMVLFTFSMVLLGVGWNIALLAGSTMVTDGAPATERSRREGWGEVGMGVAAAGGGAVAGPLVSSSGYPTLAVAGAAVAVLLLPLAVTRLHNAAQLRRRSTASTPAA
ncbi:MFS transporter [Pseudonocardia sp. TRM90224]|uniref:MFS transporter n=1 Tax=Pseudonocardia sp. TRM90224 TaxID=2812678 RepID=UPI001E32EA1F|nr:MFS transporter [Pseudonocardia sp. TRM90224]